MLHHFEANKRAQRWRRYAAIIGICLLFNFASLWWLNQRLTARFESELKLARSLTAKELTVANAADLVMPSVVGISTYKESKDKVNDKLSKVMESVGTGVIMTSDGYILTNAHVIDTGYADEITVILPEGSQLVARAVFADELLDLAVLKVEAKNLTPVKVGNSDQLVVGETAIAIGNPLGLEFQKTVTAGIISGLNRTISFENSARIENLIQTDASINPGNSGGPLVNVKGEVVGINTIKMDAAEGLGFAIPINSVKRIVEEVSQTGTFNRVNLGITALTVQEYETRTNKMTGVKNGIVIMRIKPGSPSETYGLKMFDVITHIDGYPIDNLHNLATALYRYSLGETANITINRTGQTFELPVKFQGE